MSGFICLLADLAATDERLLSQLMKSDL